MHSIYSKVAACLSLLTRASFEREGGERRSKLTTLPSGWQWVLSDAARFCARKGKILGFVFNVHSQDRPDQLIASFDADVFHTTEQRELLHCFGRALSV